VVQLRNVNPLGQVDLPLIRREGDPVGEAGRGCLEPGEVFDVDDATAAHLLEQVGNYELVTAPAVVALPPLVAVNPVDVPSADQPVNQESI